MSTAAEPRPLEVGIFARTFDRGTLDETLAAAADHGFRVLHFNFACAGLPSLPPSLDVATCRAIRDAFSDRGLTMIGVSGTYNVIHPDLARRAVETDRARRIIELSPALGTRLVSLSTGTRDRESTWRRHPDNDDAAAWGDLLDTLSTLLRAAEDADVVLGVEPERNNVVSTARRAVTLLREMRTPHLRIILDPANLVDPSAPATQRETLDEAFDLLAPSTVMLHAKDVTATGHVAAGRGFLDYDHIFELVDRHHLGVPIVIHDVAEDDVGRARSFVESLAAPLRARLDADG